MRAPSRQSAATEWMRQSRAETDGWIDQIMPGAISWKPMLRGLSGPGIRGLALRAPHLGIEQAFSGSLLRCFKRQGPPSPAVASTAASCAIKVRWDRV